MRFFSNDSRETPDDEATADERPERVTSEPVAVPVQRPASSPWAATPSAAPDRTAMDRAAAERAAAERAAAERAAAERAAAERTAAERTAADRGPAERAVAAVGRDDGSGGPVAGRPPFHEPSPQPTAFGAATVGGAVAASAMANPLDDAPGDTDRRTDAASGVADDRTVAPHDGRVADDDGPRPAGQHADVAPRPRGPRDDPDGAGAPDTTPGRPGAGRPDGIPAAAVAMPVGPGAPAAPHRPQPVDRERETSDSPAAPGRENAATGSLPGTVSAPELGPLFADRDAHAFRDRWRDVQLRFVDDPKAATEEAVTLIDEAVDALATSLKSQREQLSSAAEGDAAGDTERLRVRLRGYRDFLDRLLGL